MLRRTKDSYSRQRSMTMTILIDGPAQNDGGWVKDSKPLRRAPVQPLLLQSAPRFLRVVIGPSGEIDALDPPDDTPSRRETVVAYERVGAVSVMHIKRDRRNGGSGFFRGGRYKVMADQPDADTLRWTRDWIEWCAERTGTK